MNTMAAAAVKRSIARTTGSIGSSCTVECWLTGRSVAWLTRALWERESLGSNPSAPTSPRGPGNGPRLGPPEMKDAPAPRFSTADRVRLALALTAANLVVEVVGGIWAHSLALLSDAGHVVTDLLVLGFSAFALMQGRRPANPRKTFGYHRVGILVALGNAVILGAVVAGIVI